MNKFFALAILVLLIVTIQANPRLRPGQRVIPEPEIHPVRNIFRDNNNRDIFYHIPSLPM